MIKIILDDNREVDASVFKFSENFDEDEAKNFSVKPERKSLEEKCEFSLFDSQVTPKSSMFLKPCESPQYSDLNKRLMDIHSKFENEIEVPHIGRNQQKIVRVTNTLCSSLMLRRNKSEKNLRINSY